MKKVLYLLGMLIAMSACSDNQVNEVHPGIYILDKKQAIESFDELSQRLEGQPFFLDRWASWCSPCIEEFGHLEPLHAFLKDKQIEMVYLNSDEDMEKRAWIGFMIEHKLKGYHLRLDSTLKADMSRRLIFIPIIPQYMIVGKDGEIIKKDAKRPSAGEELYKQIGEALNL
jgi:thiol-disulfide isomerase/thioredoxin